MHVVVADHALRAVAVPAGDHTLELRYEPRPLQIGLLLSALTAVVILAISLMLAVRMRRSRRGTRQ